MKEKIILLVLFPILVIAQNNPPANYTVKNLIIGEGDHVFMNFHTNTSTTKNQSGWDIALYNEVHEIGGMINETKGVRVWRVFKDTNQFSSLSLSDTLLSVSNHASIFYHGALDTMYTGTLSTKFNIGIGDFYQDNLVTVPTKMYIIKREDNVYGKFFISYKSSGGRNFIIRYANIDNSDPKYIAVPKVTPLARHYRYVKLSDASILNDFEPVYNDWDVVFRRYKVGSTTYPIGALTNNAHNLIRISSINGFPDDYLKQGVVNTEAYEAIGDVATVTYNGSLSTSDIITRNFNQIGEKWFNTATNQPFTGRSYFLKDRNNRLWHLVFTTYDATTKSVNIAFQQKGSFNSIQSRESLNDFYSIYQENNQLVVESAEQGKNASILISDIMGKVVFKGVLNDKLKLDLNAQKPKLLFILIEKDSKLFTAKFGVH
ncbi:MAG: hypothetical protein JNL75_06930 [Chitinophagales bacterium]|nr:hypothetical protein [Chitinophagales bacterium]